jgi:AbiV family abortive infection protein
MRNVTELLEDAAALLDRGSAGRARSLVVLAGEELGKAVWVYRAAHAAWDGESNEVQVPEDFEERSRRHPPKIKTAERYRSWLAKDFNGEWPARDDDGDGEEYKDLAGELNDRKQAGFYVDWINGRMRQPSDVTADGVAEDLQGLAQAAHLLMFEDWSRGVIKRDDFRFPDSRTLRLSLLAHPTLYTDNR